MQKVLHDVEGTVTTPARTRIRQVGDRVWFEYHCQQLWSHYRRDESEKSQDAPAWHRTHQMVQVISPPMPLEDKTMTYRIRFDDGLEWEVFGDELLDSAAEFVRPGYRAKVLRHLTDFTLLAVAADAAKDAGLGEIDPSKLPPEETAYIVYGTPQQQELMAKLLPHFKKTIEGGPLWKPNRKVNVFEKAALQFIFRFVGLARPKTYIRTVVNRTKPMKRRNP